VLGRLIDMVKGEA